MTRKEAIKYLQQLYPNGGHCWLDEQRIEAIGIAVKALQEEPVSEDLEEEIIRYIGFPQEVDEDVSTTMKRKAAHHFANWQKEQDQSTIELAEDHAMLAGMEKMKEEIMAKAIDGTARPDDNEVWCNLTASNLKDGDKVKVIVIKED